MNTQIKRLFLDIETAPMLGSVWGLWDQNISLDMLEKDWYIISFSALWDGEKQVHYFDQSQEPDIENDKKLLDKLWAFLDEADEVVAQNGKRFDIPKINARLIMNGYKPPSPYRIVDTLQIAKRNFAFTSNKLEYLSDKLLPSNKKKLKHKKFPGYSLWKECLLGNKEAWKEMELYNKMDVISLQALYKKLLPWGKQKPNQAVYIDSNKKCCTHCGSTKLQSKGWVYTNVSKYQRFVCKSCGGYSRSKQMETSSEVRKEMLVPVTY